MPQQTGPKSPEGKAMVAMNRVTHGLHASPIVLPGVEDPDEWDRFHRDLVASLAPVGAMEGTLASRVAEYLWRGRRIALHERNLIAREQQLEDEAVMKKRNQKPLPSETRRELGIYAAAFEPDPEDAHTPMPPRRALPAEQSLATIIRYEAHISRQMLHALHELEALQQRRNGAPSPLARVDVQGLPGT